MVSLAPVLADLQMDLVNYAVLVFDFAPDMTLLQGVDMTNT